jgi:hypothetical protein
MNLIPALHQIDATNRQALIWLSPHISRSYAFAAQLGGFLMYPSP